MNKYKSVQIERLLTFLEGMEMHKQNIISFNKHWLDTTPIDYRNTPEIWSLEDEITKGYELLALYGDIKKEKHLALMDAASRSFIMKNWLLVPSQTFIKSFKSIFI